MFKSGLILFVLLLSGRSSWGQIIDLNRKDPYLNVFEKTDNFGESYLEVLENAYPTIEQDSIRYAMVNDLAYYWHTRDLDKAMEFAEIGMDMVRGAGNTLWEGRFEATQGAILLRMEKLDSAYAVLQTAREKVGEKHLPFVFTQIGYVFERKGQLDRAADYALEALRLGEKLGDLRSIAVAFSDLSNLFWKHGKFDKGLEYGMLSLQNFEKRGINDLDYDFTLYVVGNNLMALEKYEEALNYFKHSQAIGERYGFYNNLSDVNISLVELYSLLNEFEKAEEAGGNAVKYAELLHNDFLMMRSWLAIGKLQLLQGKYISAIESLNKCIEVATPEFGDAYYLSQAYGRLGKAYAGNHNYKDAYQAFAEYDRLKNEIFSAESDQRISLLQTEFEVAQKESTIQDQEMRIEEQRSSQILMTVITVFLVILLVVLYATFQNNKKKNRLLEEQNREKEFLLKEIHHRVKNNLGVVSSLLELQSARMTDPKVIEAIVESQNRVYSMSMVHQKLYQGKNLSSIEMKEYFVNLCDHIIDSFGAKDKVNFSYQMETLELDVDTAIPLGLIMNELITNALKHAFPKGRKGLIKVFLQKMQEGTIRLEVADNGIGADIENEDGLRTMGFGTQLIQLLTQQLEGKLSRRNDSGTSVRIEFRPT